MKEPIPVYTALTGQQAADWIQRLAPRAAAMVADAGMQKTPPADAAMTFLLASIAMAKGGGFKVREFVAVLELLGIEVE